MLSTTALKIDDLQTGLNDQKKPFVILKIKNNSNNKLIIDYEKKRLEQWGTPIEETVIDDGRTIELKISNINQLLDFQKRVERNYFIVSKEHEDLLASAITSYYNKRVHPATAKSVDLVDYAVAPESAHNNPNALHVIRTAREADYGTKTEYLIKEYKHARKIHELEPMAAAYYRLLLGADQASMMADAKRKSVVITKFMDFRNANEIAHLADLADLIKGGLIEMLAASYTLEETDLIEPNWGIRVNLNGKVVRIDFDRSLWPLFSKYLNFPSCRSADDPTFFAPNKAHPVTKVDYVFFPMLLDTTPQSWILNAEQQFFLEHVKLRKARAFLKHILLHEQPIIDAIANEYLGTEKAKRKFANYINQRLGKSKNEFMQVPEFREVVVDNPQFLNDIIKELTAYNASLPETDKHLRVNLDAIRKSHADLLIALQQPINKAAQLETIYQDMRKTLLNRLNHFETSVHLKTYVKEQMIDGEVLNDLLAKAKDVLAAVAKTKEEHPEDIERLTEVLARTLDMLSLKINFNMDFVRENKIIILKEKALQAKTAGYLNLATSLSESTLVYKLLGASMALLGGLICATGLLIATVTVIPTLTLGIGAGLSIAGAGAALTIAGIGLFATKGCKKGSIESFSQLMQTPLIQR